MSVSFSNVSRDHSSRNAMHFAVTSYQQKRRLLFFVLLKEKRKVHIHGYGTKKRVLWNLLLQPVVFAFHPSTLRPFFFQKKKHTLRPLIHWYVATKCQNRSLLNSSSMATDNAHSESKRLGKKKKMKASDSYSLNNFGAKGSQNEDTKAIPSFLSLRE